MFRYIHILSYFPFRSLHSLSLSYLRKDIPRKYSVNSFIIERKRHEESTSTDELTIKGGAPVTSKFFSEMRQVFQYCSICCKEMVEISTNYNFKLHIATTKWSKYQPTIILNCTSFRSNTLFCTVTLLSCRIQRNRSQSFSARHDNNINNNKIDNNCDNESDDNSNKTQ